nr:MAG TPA: hypothetical protein [Caudoviricetes sp.]
MLYPSFLAELIASPKSFNLFCMFSICRCNGVLNLHSNFPAIFMSFICLSFVSPSLVL